MFIFPISNFANLRQMTTTTRTSVLLGIANLFNRIHYRVFSKRQRITLRLLYAMSRPSVVCLFVCLSSVCLSSVCDVGAPYSGG